MAEKNTKAVHLLLLFSMNCSTDATGFNLKQGHIMMKQTTYWTQVQKLPPDFCENRNYF